MGRGDSLVRRPSSSNEVLDADQQPKIADQVREYIDSMVPKRPTKPNRSDIDSAAPYSQVSYKDQNIPELKKFRSLLNLAPLIYSTEGASIVQEEFVETQYYTQLNSIDKQHHTTGSGFIKVVGDGGEDGYVGFHLQSGRGGRETKLFRSNPAKNDWIPTTDGDI